MVSWAKKARRNCGIKGNSGEKLGGGKQNHASTGGVPSKYNQSMVNMFVKAEACNESGHAQPSS